MKIAFVLGLLVVSVQLFAQGFENLSPGKSAPDFKLKTITGGEAHLGIINSDRTVVLVVLRGWPGYQCPVCTKQVGSLIADASKFNNAGAAVLLVYPGPAEQLQEHAKEFSEDYKFPDNFYFTLDPDYSIINKFGLRWDAPNETAYPSTFVINKKGVIVFSKVSTTHGGRATNEEILKALEKQ